MVQAAEELKKKGNEALKKGDADEAIKLYTEAIQLDPNNHVLYSNRCAAYMRQEKYSQALEDAEATIKIKPDWAKVRQSPNLYMSILYSYLICTCANITTCYTSVHMHTQTRPRPPPHTHTHIIPRL